jgi:hypothetical protein
MNAGEFDLPLARRPCLDVTKQRARNSVEAHCLRCSSLAGFMLRDEQRWQAFSVDRDAPALLVQRVEPNCARGAARPRRLRRCASRVRMNTSPLMDAAVIDLTRSERVRTDVLEASLELPEPRSRLLLRIPAGKAGRAEAIIDERSWAAKHYWQQEPGVMAYEFDEPLPAGRIVVRVPFEA